MDTITATVIDYEPIEFVMDGITIPVVIGWNADGTPQTARDLAARQRIDPADCDHAGATWSSNLAMRCPKCGSPMFMPPKLLAYLPAATIQAMDLLWNAAGWPEWRGLDWSIVPEYWAMQSHPLFDHCGGIPVRLDHLEKWYDTLLDIAEDDHE